MDSALETFKDAETRYSAHELKVLAVINGIKRYEIFLRPKHFTVIADSVYVKEFRGLSLSQSHNRRLVRWMANVFERIRLRSHP